MPEAEVEWVSDVSRESFFDNYKGKVIIRMNPSKDNDINLAKATLIQVSKGVIPESRLYVGPKMNTSIDLSLVKKLLLKQGQKNAYSYFLNEITVPELEDKDVVDYLSKIEIMDNAGLFTRLFLRELKELPVIRGLSLQNIPEIRSDVRGFFDYAEIVASRKPREHIPLQFEGTYIKTAIIYVAIYRRMEDEGAKPYIKRALLNRKNGCEIIFFISFSHAIEFTRKLIEKLTNVYGMELVKSSDKEYVIDDSHFICATILTNPNYILKPQDDLLLQDLLIDSVNETLDESGWANLNSVEIKIKEKLPTFNAEDYGYSTLKDLFDVFDSFESKISENADGSPVIMVRCRSSDELIDIES